MLNKKILYPYLLLACSIFPILNIYKINIFQLTLKDIIYPGILTLLASIVIFLLFNKVLTNKFKSSLISYLTILFFYNYGPITRFITELFFQNTVSKIYTYSSFAFGALLFTVLLFLIIKIVKTSANLLKVTEAATVGSLLLIAWSCIHIIVFQFFTPDSSNTLSPLSVPKHSPKIKPNVYHIILDGYANYETLLSEYNFQNTLFEIELKNLGFWIPRNSYANFITTPTSTTSTLDMTYFESLSHTKLSESDDQRPLQKLFKHSRAVRYFKAMGYKYYHIHSTVNFTKYHSLATKHLETADSKIARFEELNHIITKETPLYHVIQIIRKTIGKKVWSSGFRERNLNIFTQLRNAPKNDGPFLIFAHFLMPHPPYLFGPNGEDMEGHYTNNDLKGSIWANRDAYIGQTQYLNTRLSELVNHILEMEKDVKPIILIHSDHGPDSFGIKHRLKNFIALYNPYDNTPRPNLITNINLYPLIIDSIFNDNQFYQPNRLLQNSYEKPLKFDDITDTILTK